MQPKLLRRATSRDDAFIAVWAVRVVVDDERRSDILLQPQEGIDPTAEDADKADSRNNQSSHQNPRVGSLGRWMCNSRYGDNQGT
jgi:hypothetical protein